MKKEEKFPNNVKHGGAASVYKRAIGLGIKTQPLKNDPKIIKMSYGGKDIFMKRSKLPVCKMIGDLTTNKSTTKSLLRSLGIKVPNEVIIEKGKYNINKIKKAKLQFPLIVKPQNGSRAKGVTWNVLSYKDIDKAYRVAQKATKGPVLIEEMFTGDELRVLVYKNRVLSAVHKIPAGVTGDGKSTIGELIERFDETRKDGFKIRMDKIAKETLIERGYNLKTVLEKNYFLQLRFNVNMSDGGRCVARTKDFNKLYKKACIDAASGLNLQLAGIDIIVKNIEKPGSYVILEVNSNPYINMHEKELTEGQAVDVSGIILADLYPALKTKIAKTKKSLE